MKTKLKIFIFGLALFFPVLLFAYQFPGKPTGFLNDFTGILTVEQKGELESKLSNLEKQTGNELSIAIINSLGGDTVDNFAVNLFQDWQIGKKDKDNGALFLIVIQDKKIRIEVGYGLEPYLTDAKSYWIINNLIVPNFKEGKYFDGINLAVLNIADVLSGVDSIPNDDNGNSRNFGFLSPYGFVFIFFIFQALTSLLSKSKSWWLGGVLGGVFGLILGLLYGFLYAGVAALVILIPLGLIFDYFVSKNYEKYKASGRRIPWWFGGGRGPGGGGFGGFGGFGGGRSGGGGASGGWSR